MVKTMGVEPKKFMSQGVPVKALYSRGVKVWPVGEPPTPGDTDFSITVNSGADKLFMIPVSGGWSPINLSYAWIVDWGDGTISEHIGRGEVYGTGIMHIYPQANTLYTIKIKPQDENELGWFKVFGFDWDYPEDGLSASISNKQKVIIVNGQLTEQMIGSTGYACYGMFDGCTNVTMGKSFNFSPDISSLGFMFGYRMFRNCTSLKMNGIFQIPQGITPLGRWPFAYAFQGCTGLTDGIANFFGKLVFTQAQLDQLGVYDMTFYNCSSLTETLSDIPQLQEIPSDRRHTFEGCPPDLIAPLHANWK